MAEDFQVIVIGSGVAGAMIAWKLASRGVKVLMLEAGGTGNRLERVGKYAQADFAKKTPHSPYRSASNDQFAPSPDSATDYYDQPSQGDQFKSTYERIVGGSTSHWLGHTPRLIPSDFRMRSLYGVGVDWPITYADLEPWYCRAECEIGVAGDDDEWKNLLGAFRSEAFPMSKIWPSFSDLKVAEAINRAGLDVDGVKLKVLSTPSGRNSQPYDNRPVCAGNSSCVPICPIQAKYDASVHVTKAIKAGVVFRDKAVVHRLEVGTDHRVRHVTMSTFDTSRERVLVLDKNALRAAAAIAAKTQADAAGLGVLVIDTTFKEIARGGNWPTHYENDFRDWTDKPDRMSVAWGVGELLREERQTSKAASVVDGPMTARHRQLVTALAAGDRTALIAAGVKVSTETSRMSGPGGELDAAGRLALMPGMTDVWWKRGSDAVRQVIAAELNDPGDGPLVRLGQIVMTNTSLRTTLQSSLEQTGCSPALAASLLQAPTFTNFLHSTFEAYSLILWARGQRLDAVNAERFLNQMLDLDYVAYGLCCAGLVTDERIIRRMEAGLRSACQLLWP